MNTINTSHITNIILGNLSIDIIDLYHLFTSNELSDSAHEHSFLELHMILDGQADLYINKELFHVKKNDVLLIPKNSPHFSNLHSTDFLNCAFSFDFHCTEKTPKNRFEYAYFSEFFNTHAPILLQMNAYERSLIENILKNMDDLSIYSINKINTEIANFFLEISQKLHKSLKKDLSALFANSSNQAMVRKYKVEALIHKSVMDSLSLTLEDLAQHLYLSPRQTSRFIQESFQLSFKELLTRYRMIAAKELLNDNVPIEKVAYKVGFSSYQGFLTAYKKYYGTLPSMK